MSDTRDIYSRPIRSSRSAEHAPIRTAALHRHSSQRGRRARIPPQATRGGVSRVTRAVPIDWTQSSARRGVCSAHLGPPRLGPPRQNRGRSAACTRSQSICSAGCRRGAGEAAPEVTPLPLPPSLLLPLLPPGAWRSAFHAGCRRQTCCSALLVLRSAARGAPPAWRPGLAEARVSGAQGTFAVHHLSSSRESGRRGPDPEGDTAPLWCRARSG